MYPTKFSVSLRIRLFNKALDLPEICDALGLEPGRTWTIGEPRTTPQGDPLPGVYDFSYCYFKLARQGDEELHEMLDRLSDSLHQHLDLFRRIRSAGGTIEFYIFWVSIGNTGEVFDSQLLSKLATLGIDLDIDVLGETAPPDSDTESHAQEATHS